MAMQIHSARIQRVIKHDQWRLRRTQDPSAPSDLNTNHQHHQDQPYHRSTIVTYIESLMKDNWYIRRHDIIERVCSE